MKNKFFPFKIIIIKNGEFFRKVNLELLRGQRASTDIMDPKTGKLLVKRNRKIGLAVIKQLQSAGVEMLSLPKDEVIGKIIGKDIIDDDTGEVLFPVNQDVTESVLDAIVNRGILQFEILFIDDVNVDSSFRDTLISDKTATTEEALLEIYRRMRPGDLRKPFLR